MEIHIREGSIAEAVALGRELQEFSEPYKEDIYLKRLTDVPHLILIAAVDNKPVGFKVGYQSSRPDTFYSWMGGVLESYRRKGIATMLAERQEEWAKRNGFLKVSFKTRNHLTNMVFFGLNRGFIIVDLIKKGEVKDYRIMMEKNL